MTFSKGISRAVAMGIALLIGFGLVAPAAQAAYIVNLLQEGSDVVASGSGTIDLAGLSPSCPTSCETNAGMLPSALTHTEGSPSRHDVQHWPVAIGGQGPWHSRYVWY